MIKKETVEKIKKIHKGNIESMKSALFSMEMDDRISDWDFYRGLAYCIAVAESKPVDHYGLTD